MRYGSRARRFFALILCWTLSLPIAPVPAKAADAIEPECKPPSDKASSKRGRFRGPQYVRVDVGQPSVWSLGQAHYLIANMHERDRDLSTKTPSSDDLDPNRINSNKLETLRTVLQVEGQFDQALGVKNKLETQRFGESRTRQQQAQDALPERRADLAEVNRELGLLNEELAVLTEQDRQSTESRSAAKPPAPASADDNARKMRIVVLTARVEAKKTEKTRLESEISSLESTAGAAVTAPDIKGPDLTAGRASLPASTALDTFVNRALNNFNQPNLAASTALDNFVGMQYEIIAKQLTLLRDEVGPDERVIFLELPASIYTADQWANDYVAQVEWKVTRYFDQEPSETEKTATICGNLPVFKDSKEGKLTQSQVETAVEATDLSLNQLDKCLHLYPESALNSHTGEVRDDEMQYPVTLDMIIKSDPEGKCAKDPDSTSHFKVHALDIIPRQSALNINENHATVKNVGILGFFKWLSGVGVKLDYERQREVYEQFLYQDVFASGFGKGSDTFGWTFGPLPGSRRLEPGQRTTYAVLAVPRNTLALELAATPHVYKRFQMPEDHQEETTRFIVSVPGPQTEAFVIERVNYTPVPKGTRTAVVLKGNYLSPQLGVIVNGTPLKRVISIARTGSKEEAPAAPGSGIQGEFEITNSRQMVASFSMGSDFVGTPMITLVAPEKSVALNFTKMIVNNRYKRPTSLHVVSSFEPMFIDGFNLTAEVTKIGERTFMEGGADREPRPVKYVIARLDGKGLRHDSDVFVNQTELGVFPLRFPTHREIEAFYEKKGSLEVDGGGLAGEVDNFFKSHKSFAVQESTGAYILFLEDPGDNWTVRYRQRTRQGFEESSFKKSFAKVPVTQTIRHYQRGPAGGPAELFLTLASNVGKIDAIQTIEPEPVARRKDPCSFQDDGGTERRVKCLVARDRGRERELLTVKVSFKKPKPAEERKSEKEEDGPPAPTPVLLDISIPVQPTVVTVVNPGTGTASGPSGQAAFVVIKGEHLESVKAVFFGDQAGTDLAAGAGGLTVKVPKMDGVPKGQSVAVPVLFQIKGDDETKLPSGAFYTYLGEPLPQVAGRRHPSGTYPAATASEPRNP